MSYFQAAGQNKRAWARIGDTRPRVEVQLLRQDTGVAFDISAGTGIIEVCNADNATYLLSGNPVIMNEGNGVAYYNWAVGDLALAGTYNIIFRLDVLNDGNYLSVPEEPYSYVLRVK